MNAQPFPTYSSGMGGKYSVKAPKVLKSPGHGLYPSGTFGRLQIRGLQKRLYSMIDSSREDKNMLPPPATDFTPTTNTNDLNPNQAHT